MTAPTNNAVQTQHHPKHIGRASFATLPAANAKGVDLYDLAFCLDGPVMAVYQAPDGTRALIPLYSSPSGNPVNAGEIVFGGANGALKGDETLRYSNTTHVYEQRDSNNASFVYVDGASANRSFEVRDVDGDDLFFVDAKGGVEGATFLSRGGLRLFTMDMRSTSRELAIWDETDLPVWDMSGLSTGRSTTLYDGTGNAMMFAFTRTVQRTWTFSDEAEADMLTHDLRSAQRSSTWQDDAANPIFKITTLDVTPKIVCSVPFTLASFTVGALPTPPPAGVGSTAWASNGRKTGEGGGAGTGVQVAYSAAGPAGAGWYPAGLAAALITA